MRLLSSVSAQISWGLLMILRVLVAGGSAVALSEHRNRPLPYIDLFGVTYFVTTPAVARQMFEIGDAGQYLASLRCIRIGGAMCSAELLRRLMALSPARVAVGYGAAEFGELCIALLDPAEDIPEGYIGEITRPEFEIAFFDDRMQALPGASEGVVGFRDTSGDWGRDYLNPAPGDARTGFIGGFFFPGDIMRREGQSLFLIGRIKNIINVSGNKISLDAVQAVLEDALAVSALACFAEPDALGLERLVLAYTADFEIAPEAAEAVLAQRFPGLGLAAMHRLATLPIGPSGKIDMPALSAELQRKPTVTTS